MEDYKKKYKEALEWMRELYPTMVSCADKEAALKYFPEIKESENERTRKELINYLDNFTNSEDRELVDKFIAWLEKQGELKPAVVIPKFRVGDVIRIKGSNAEHKITDISGVCYRGNGWGLDIIAGDESNVYELVEQKPAWSEVDEINLEKAIWYVENPAPMVVKDSMLVEWLKSLRPQNRWKPSDEQMKCISDVVADAKYRNDISTNGYEPYTHLSTLLQQLKKLK